MTQNLRHFQTAQKWHKNDIVSHHYSYNCAIITTIITKMHRNHFALNRICSRLHSGTSLSITSKDIGNGMTAHTSRKDSSTDLGRARKIVVITGWLNANQRQLKPYINFYLNKGFEAITISVNPKHILSPKSGQKQMEHVMDEVMKVPTNSVVFHQFSTGGYLFAQLLRSVAMNPANDNFKKFHNSISAQIFDSPPDVEGIATGISKSFSSNPIMESVSKFAVSTYLTLAKDSAGVEHREASKFMHANTLQAPSLWFYSKADEIAAYQDCEKVIKSWRNNNIHVEECVWDNTPHIQHARVDPTRYFNALDSFLLKHNLLH